MELDCACTEQDMLWEWARAERHSNRYAVYYQFPSTEEALLDQGKPFEHYNVAAEAAIERVRAVRQPLLADLLQLGVQWSYASMNVSEIGKVRLMRCEPFMTLTPNDQTFGGLVAALQRTNPSSLTDSFSREYYAGLYSFDPAKIVGRPVLVATSTTDPANAIEGYRRLSILWTKFVETKLGDRAVPVIFGECANLSAWRWYWH